jgi:hypothetical protein
MLAQVGREALAIAAGIALMARKAGLNARGDRRNARSCIQLAALTPPRRPDVITLCDCWLTSPRSSTTTAPTAR